MWVHALIKFIPMKFAIGLSLLACMSGHAAEQTEMQWPIKRYGRLEISPQAGDMVVTLRATDSEWIVDSNASINQPDVEQIWFKGTGQSGEIIVMAKPYNPARETGRSLCAFGGLASAAEKDRAVGGYTECTSAFFKCATTLTDLLLILPAVMTATRICPMQLDPEKVQSALKSARINDWIQTFNENRQRQRYISAFKEIKTSTDADWFIKSYQHFDPEVLVDKARELKESLIVAEVENARRQTAAREQLLADQAAREAEQAKRRQEAAQKAQEKIQETEKFRQTKARDFRKKIELGSETFCGPVIEIRAPMVRIAISAPLSGYSSEAWLKLDNIYPAEIATCQNINGRLTAVFKN